MATPETMAAVAAAEINLAQMQAKKEAEDAAEAALAALANTTVASARVKSLAVELHTLLCGKSHAEGPVAPCLWQFETENYDDAAQADWTKADHALWLTRARSGIKAMRDLGFTVTDP